MTGYNNIVLVGASGSIGKIILDGLIASSNFNITVFSRKESKASFPAGIIVSKTDFSDPDLEAAFTGQDAVISALGSTAFGEQQRIVDFAARSGVKRFIPSEFSASSQDEAALRLLPLFDQKKELIEYLKTKQSDGLSCAGIATGLFSTGYGLGNGFLEFDIANRTANIWDGGDKSFTLTNEKQLGQAVVSVLQPPKKRRKKRVPNGSRKRPPLRNKLGKLSKKLGVGDFTGAFALVRATSYGNTSGLRASYAKDETLANEVLDLKLETVKDTVKRVVAQWLKD